MTEPTNTPPVDHMVEFDEHWRPILTDQFGTLDLDKVARELADYRHVLDNVSEVYMRLTGEVISKPLTAPDAVIEAATRHASGEGRRLAQGLLEIAELAMPETYLDTDSRCTLARSVLARTDSTVSE